MKRKELFQIKLKTLIYNEYEAYNTLIGFYRSQRKKKAYGLTIGDASSLKGLILIASEKR